MCASHPSMRYFCNDEVFFATGYYYPVFLRTCRRRYSSAKEGVGLRIASVSVEAHSQTPVRPCGMACQLAPNRREVLYAHFFPQIGSTWRWPFHVTNRSRLEHWRDLHECVAPGASHSQVERGSSCNLLWSQVNQMFTASAGQGLDSKVMYYTNQGGEG